MAKQFLKTNDHLFASRPHTAAGKYTNYHYSNITWAPYGPYWRQGRKIFLTEMFSSKRLESYEYIRVEERQAFISRLYALSGKPVMLKEHLSRVTLSVISRIVLGEKYFSEFESGRSMVTVEECQKMLGYVKRMKALRHKFDRFYDHVLEKHRARREAEDFVAKDMVDMLLRLADDPDIEVKLTTDGIKGFTQDLIAGGTDTSATTLEWAMSEVLRQPNIANKATEELDRVIGRNRWVEEKDIPQLPYIDAIVKETMRLHPVTVLLAPHLALQDCHVAGYDIRKGTRVLINTWSIGRDPNLWDAPEEFFPERFLGKAIDVKGQNFELLPFGSGRRMCPGYSLALKMIGSSLANMLHGFHWKLPGDMKPEELNIEEVFGLTTPRKVPLVAFMEPRLPSHLY
ncbi:Cytochrome P450 71A1 [Vitis vinifera]|uniref:Cytochrome P450 71A1 n=1 Tax=Vitis vinifera TaxID=29760 RepID=A0A438E8Q3_VITVI|nr:Cytochrome P450 71A1 [Vitis vinifera]